ncbi:hypothetical protein SHAM105786_00650 [Shewanella amazonensis]|uniref:Uncharacterized protein n=1 Tax=Shewanella amazonensis (strain ATCC BAA-1098 / SB2B) TaxID=326297 RepID=A1S6I7_SHEAM|nr:hypothetical protein [Shewanella amazonensis]ABL99993.1 hypothetical protein Sama_1788 [Shewanella amazonensis SB2B]
MKYVNLGVPVPVLAQLLYEGQLCAADIKCLDAESKQQLWQLCLWACKQRVDCKKTAQLITTANVVGKSDVHDAQRCNELPVNGGPLESDNEVSQDECTGCLHACSKHRD